MSLYALGDLHLSFQSDKSMDIFGSVWKRHERKIEKYVNRIVKPDDMNILVREYRCSGGTDTANPAAGNRCSGTGIPHLLNCLLPASLLA